MSKIEFVQAYYDLWMGKNNSSIEDFFTEDAVYVEAYGPEHLGQEALKRWFADWTGKAKVLQWRVRCRVCRRRQNENHDGISVCT